MANDNFEVQLYKAYMEGSVSDSALDALGKLQDDVSCAGYLASITSHMQLCMKMPSDPTCIFHGAAPQYLEKVKQEQPLISVIVPTHNRVDMLCRCIDSILMQEYQNVEILIIDDQSTDETQTVTLQKYSALPNVIYFCNDTNLGPGRSRQKGFRAAKGKFIVFADDDDFYIEPTFFIKAAALFLEYSNVAVVGCNSVICDLEQKALLFHPLSFCGVMKKEQYFLGFGSKYIKPNSTFPTMLRKSVLDSAGFADMQMMNDTSIYLRASCFGDVCMLKDWVGVYWVHKTNISKSLPHQFIIENLDEKRNILHIARQQLDCPLDEWYYAQLMITIRYYLDSDRISFYKMLSLVAWILKKGAGVKRRLLKNILKYRYKVL